MVVEELGYFCNLQKAVQSKQSTIGRKFARSGDPGLVFDTLRAVGYQIIKGKNI
jgi:hypothetical protein